ncbi:hypothetical protein C1646_772020 [Rhizophagus diaphanus]|nr:hypothetical protein C1646_772020 [Rhizophagus diaphanus] [Rhizophagus sp. MUCL 43196]
MFNPTSSNHKQFNFIKKTENKSDAELELEVNYKLVIKQADDKEINANDYNVSFKSEKAQGAGTLLVDVCDFENFKSEYIKLAAAKKESNSDNEEAICNESIPKTNNNNKVPKISDISVLDQRIAKNVTDNMMFSTWVTEMLNGLATIKEPPTHPSFAYTHPPKNRSQSIIPQFSNNILQTSSQPSSQQTIPLMAEFLHQIDEIKKTEDYYFKFLEGFEK